MAYLDPHEEIWKKETGQWYDIQQPAGEAKDTFAPFNGLKGFSFGTSYFHGTFFRFPLRSISREKRVSSHVYTVSKLREILTALREEARVMLLFLRKVRVIRVHEISKRGGCTDLLTVSSTLEYGQQRLSSQFHQHLRTAFERFAYNITCPIQSTIKFKVKVEDFIDPLNSSESEWLVASRVGSPNSKVHQVAEALKALPWVGVALETTESRSTGGRVFCVLPMPSEVSCHLPVHVNATFSLNDECRELKWSGIERKNDPSSDWNELIVQHLLPPCYAGLLLSHAKHVLTSDAFYRAWPEVDKLRFTHWEGLLGPLFQQIFSESVFWSHDEMWVAHDMALFTPFDTEVPDVVTAVLSSYGEEIVTLPSNVWDAINYSDLSVSQISPKIVRKTLRRDHEGYSVYNYDKKQELLQYCLSDGKIRNIIGFCLLPLANKKFASFDVNRPRTTPIYLCSTEYPSCIIPDCKNLLVDIPCSGELYESLVSLAKSKITQLAMLDTSGVAALLRKCLPASSFVALPHELVNIQWLELFWEWVTRQQSIHHFSDLLVVPAYDPLTQEECVVRLSQDSPAVYSETSISSDLFNVLGKFGVKCCEKSRFPFMPVLSVFLVNQFSPDGVLDAICVADYYRRNVVMTTQEAAALREFLSTCSKNTRRKSTLKELAIFTTLPNSKKGLCSVSQVPSAKIEPEYFPLSPQNLPFQLILFSESEYAQLVLLQSLSVPQPTCVDLLVDHVFPLIRYSRKSVNLMKEVLDNIYKILSYTSTLQKEKLKDGIKTLPFLPVVKHGLDLHKPTTLFTPSDPLLQKLFKGKHVFPVEPFHSEKSLAVLKSYGLKTKVSQQELVDLILEMTALAGKEIRYVDSTTYTKAKAILEYIGKLTTTELSQVVDVHSMRTTFSRALVYLARLKSWLPAKAAPTQDYPEQLLWKGTAQSQHLVSYGASTILCHNNQLLELACGSQVYFVDHSLPVEICQLFSHEPDIIVKQVMAHLGVIVNSFKLSSQVKTVTQAVYQVLNDHIRYTIHKKALLPTKCIYISRQEVFVSPSVVAVKQNASFRRSLEPFIYTLPDDLYPFAALFKSIGVKQHVSKQQIIGIMGQLKEGTPENLGIGREDAWELVMTILNWLTGNGEHPVDVSDCDSLYVPIEDPSSDWPILEKSAGVVYTDNDFLRQYIRASDSEHYKFVNHRIPPQMAQLLHLTPLSESLDVAEDAFEDVGQCEPLTVRLKNILKDYKDGLTIIKELLQNADDAGATEVNICYDARNHTVSGSKLLFPGMASCHGPALVVHNNAVFTQDDFKNITKLAGATKEGKTLKIGKFGVGFCSVYHMTDVPSFISNQYLYIFDPTLAYLKEDIKNLAQPGKKVNHCTNIVMKYQQLVPYQGLFGFKKGHSYKGTMFRFPFRTTASELSGNIYTSNVVKQVFKDIQRNGSELLLFLQQVKCIKVHVVGNGRRSPQVQVEITKKVIRVCDSINIVKICCSTGCTTYWLVATHSDTVLKQLATASVACSLSVPTPYTPQSIEGEVFCFLPLSVKTGLPVHISSNFAVTTNRTGLWTSDDTSTNIQEVKWNESLMKTVIPNAYFTLLVNLKQMSLSSQLGEYLFYKLWPLGENLKIHNPWNLMLNALYKQIQQSDLFFSTSINEWLPLSRGQFFSPGILSTNPVTIPPSVVDVATHLNMPIISLPQTYHTHLCITQSTINEKEFLECIFQNIDFIPVSERNQVLCMTLQCYATKLDKNSKRESYLSSCLRLNACIPCTPDGRRLRKCCEVVNPNAKFASLFDEDEGLFPIKEFHGKQLISTAMGDLGIISSPIPIEMLKERAKTISLLYKDRKSKALERTKLILTCLGTYSSHYEEDEEISKIPFLPVMPKPKNYVFRWFGNESKLLSGKQLMLKGEIGNKRKNMYIASSQVAFTNEHEPKDGGCGHLSYTARNILKIRDTPTPGEVVAHFINVIQVYTSQSTHSKDMIKVMDTTVSHIYSYLENALSKQNLAESKNESPKHGQKVDLSPLSTLPCIWTGRQLVTCERVAMDWKSDTGPCLYKVPDRHKVHLWNELKIKPKFTLDDFIVALKEISEVHGSSTVSEQHKKVLTDIISLMNTDIPEEHPSIMLPDENFVMHEASSLAFNDAQWLPQEKGIQYVNHKLVTRDLAEKLGVRMLSSKVLDKHRITMSLEGEKFGQNEKLTTRIQGILYDYPFDVTILKELLQNADDAKATKMYVILDKRTHGRCRLPSENWQELQGPALLVWNDSVFSERDIEGIQKLGIGNKRSDADTIGQYGIGFNSVYHLTDCPSFITAGSLCIFDPHCKYAPDSFKESHGERFKISKNFWSLCPDLKPAYLQSDIQGGSECKKILGGSLFRFPLRHTQELVDASEIVRANVGPKIFEGVLTASKMHDYLKKWAPQMKQSMFFLNHVTELKFFVISEKGNNQLSLEHHYQVIIDHTAATQRNELHQKLTSFCTAQRSEPFVTKYKLTLTDREAGKESMEQWLIQQGVGDIYNKEQQWQFIDQVKPRHGIAVPLKLATDPRKFRGRVFCFLPLPLDCNLPVHINGHFILHSSRRALWRTTNNDDIDSKQQWNTALLKAIASSYAQLLITIKEDYKIENGEVDLRDIKRYYQIFPSWTAPQEKSSSVGGSTHPQKGKKLETVGATLDSGKHPQVRTESTSSKVKAQAVTSKVKAQGGTSSKVKTQAGTSSKPSLASQSSTDNFLPTNEWLKLAKDVFRALATMNAPVIAVTQLTQKRMVVKIIEWSPPKDRDPALQVYFIDHDLQTPTSVLEKIGMKLTNTQNWIRKHFGTVNCIIPVATESNAYKYYARFYKTILPAECAFPCSLRDTPFKSVEKFKQFYMFISSAIPEQKAESENASADPLETSVETEQIHYPPLIVTADGVLRDCNHESDRVIKSSFPKFFQQCLQYFVHPELLDVKIPKTFLLSSSEEGHKACLETIIHKCLTAVLPGNLLNVPDTACSKQSMVPIAKLWECLGTDDEIFNTFLKSILDKWALLLSTNGRLYSSILEEEAILPIIALPKQPADEDNTDNDFQISFEVCKSTSAVYQHLDLPFLNTDTVPPAAVKNICPTLLEPAFMLQVLHNFHCQTDISQFITGNMADTLLVYFGHIHLKKDGKSLNYLKHLPLFQTHEGRYTSLGGKEVYQWPDDMCTDEEEIWLQNIDEDVVFLDPMGAWSELGLHSELNVHDIHPTEIYCLFVFDKFGDMNEALRTKHLQHIRDSFFEDAVVHSKMEDSPKKYASQTFVQGLRDLKCIGSHHPLRAINEFYDHKHPIFSTFRDNFLFLPDNFRKEKKKWKHFLEELGFHFKITSEQYLELCHEMANKQHTSDTRNKSLVLFTHLFKDSKDTQKWFNDRDFCSKVVEIPFVLADSAEGYTWIAKTPPERHAKGTCEIHTDENEILYLTKLNRACWDSDMHLVWAVMPVYRVPRQELNPSWILSDLGLQYHATISDVVHNLVAISETGRADPKLFDEYTAPTPSYNDNDLIAVIAKCFEFLNQKPYKECDINVLKEIPCIPVPVSGDKKEVVLVKPPRALMPDLTNMFFPYLHCIPYELMASKQLLETLGVKTSIDLSHIQFVLSTVHDQLRGDQIDSKAENAICQAMNMLPNIIILCTNESNAGEILSPLYLPGFDNHMHHSLKLVYADTYSYKDCQLPESADFTLFHHPNPLNDQYVSTRSFCNALPRVVRPKPLSEICLQTVTQDCTIVHDDIDMARYLKRSLRLELLPAITCSAFRSHHITLQENAEDLLSDFFHAVDVVTVHNLKVEVTMKRNEHPMGLAKVDFLLHDSGEQTFRLYLDSNIGRMLEGHIHMTVAQELLGTIASTITTQMPAQLPRELEEVFSLFLKSETNEDLHKACQIKNIENTTFIRTFIKQVGHPISEEWHYMLDQNPDNTFHTQEIVGYEKDDGNFVFAKVLYAIPPQDPDLNQGSNNSLLTKYMITFLNETIVVTALDIFKFVRDKRESLAIANTDEREQESLREEGRFSDVTETKRHLCQLLKQIWRMNEPERSRVIRRLYLQWHPDKNLDNVELANEVFTFLKKQIEILEQGLDPEEIDEDEVEEFSPSPQWGRQYSAWEETAKRHKSHHSRHYKSQPHWDWGDLGMAGSQRPEPDVAEGQRWVQQAEYDFMALEVLYTQAIKKDKLCSHVCFMAHEVAEKALKGGMYAVCGLGPEFLKDHFIYSLSRELQEKRMQLASDLPSLTQQLQRFYLDTRFPNRCPGSVPSHLFTIGDAQQAQENARNILNIVQSILKSTQSM